MVAENDFLHPIDGGLGELKTIGLISPKVLILIFEYGFLSLFSKTKPRQLCWPNGTIYTFC